MIHTEIAVPVAVAGNGMGTSRHLTSRLVSSDPLPTTLYSRISRTYIDGPKLRWRAEIRVVCYSWAIHPSILRRYSSTQSVSQSSSHPGYFLTGPAGPPTSIVTRLRYAPFGNVRKAWLGEGSFAALRDAMVIVVALTSY